MTSRVRSFGTDWTAAEQFCDEWAGDSGQHIAVVEDYDHDNLMVMPYADALEMVDRQADQCEIKYDADYSPEGIAARG